ncbi:MAG TPA: YbbC/YhhH family protein [Gemmatimonadaceae bacterium]|nr:YbbC/YhhH family protein [Gemmatimonadaceae bacterium]
MKRTPLTLLLCVVAALPWLTAAQRQQPRSYVPPQGFVPDARTAVRIAVAVWSPIYGEDHIAGEAPYQATLHDSVWTVEGTLHCGGPVCLGGVAEAEIARRDGRILRVSHGR